MADRQLYARIVGSRWPIEMPAPTDAEAIVGAKRLWRAALGTACPFPVKLTSGNRSTWVWDGVLVVNPNLYGQGWRDIVHSIAHLAHRLLHPEDRPHTDRAAYIERDLVTYVLSHGFLEGRLRRASKPAAKSDIIKVRFQRIVAREKSWRAKLRRAEKALDKVVRERAAYSRRHGDRVN